jgi:peptide chain release factor 1
MKILKSRLYDKMMTEKEAQITAQRRSLVKTGDRSEKNKNLQLPPK